MDGFQLVRECRNFCRRRAVQIQAGACLIDEVNRLVRQIAVGDIALGQGSCLLADCVRNVYAMEVFIVAAHTHQDFCGVCNRRFVDGNRLEAALECGVLFDIFAVFREGCRADHLNLAARECRLEDVCGVHRAFGIACADDVVHFVDDKDDVAERLDLVDEALHAAFKLSAELRARDKCRQVEQMDFLVFQLIRHLTLRNANGKPLCDRRLADARLADEARIVLLSAVENLDDTFGLAFASDDGIQLTQPCARRQIGAVRGQVLAFFRLFFLAAAVFFRFHSTAVLGSAAGRRVAVLREHLFEEREGMGAPEIKGVIRFLLCADLVIVFGFVVVFVVRIGVGERVHVGHFTGNLVEVVICNAHLAHQAVNRLETQLTGTFQAVAFIGCGTILHLGNKHDCHVFVAAGAKWHMHRDIFPFFGWDLGAFDFSDTP